MPEHFVIFCDESAEKGTYYSHFYGGALLRWEDRQAVEAALCAKKAELNIKGEMKWSKITENYADKYIDFLDLYFDMIASGLIKVRIMFSQNIYVKPEFDEDRIDNEYFILYYHFIKLAFGLRYWNHSGEGSPPARITVYLDDPPQGEAKFHSFKSYMASLSQFPVFSAAQLSIAYEDISGIDSKKHSILQGLDIILGGIQSRLNEQHTKPVPPAKRRSKRAKAKERVYAKIKDRIWEIYPRLNVGTSTAVQNGLSDRWDHPYRHWRFVPTGSTMDLKRGKRA